MKRLLAGFAGVLGLSWLLRRRRSDAPAVEQAPDPRAEELRAKIDEAKAAGDDRDEFEAGETPVDAVDPDTRRRAVHEDARARIDEMRGESEAVGDE